MKEPKNPRNKERKKENKKEKKGKGKGEKPRKKEKKKERKKGKGKKGNVRSIRPGKDMIKPPRPHLVFVILSRFPPGHHGHRHRSVAVQVLPMTNRDAIASETAWPRVLPSHKTMQVDIKSIQWRQRLFFFWMRSYLGFGSCLKLNADSGTRDPATWCREESSELEFILLESCWRPRATQPVPVVD
jgi:hypothetical protein